MIVVEKTLANLQLTLTLSDGTTGATATVAIRNAAGTTSYMDWADGVFKTSGWTTKNGAMTDLSDGIYVRNLPVSTETGITAGMILAAEYTATGIGIDTDMIQVNAESISTDVTLLRKMMTNKLVEVSGNPGTLVLYDDDGTTALKTWTLLDETGAAVTAAAGSPARRSAAT